MKMLYSFEWFLNWFILFDFGENQQIGTSQFRVGRSIVEEATKRRGPQHARIAHKANVRLTHLESFQQQNGRCGGDAISSHIPRISRPILTPRPPDQIPFCWRNNPAEDGISFWTARRWADDIYLKFRGRCTLILLSKFLKSAQTAEFKCQLVAVREFEKIGGTRFGVKCPDILLAEHTGPGLYLRENPMVRKTWRPTKIRIK